MIVIIITDDHCIDPAGSDQLPCVGRNSVLAAEHSVRVQVHPQRDQRKRRTYSLGCSLGICVHLADMLTLTDHVGIGSEQAGHDTFIGSAVDRDDELALIRNGDHTQLDTNLPSSLTPFLWIYWISCARRLTCTV